ncbi:hypothetical protein BH23BAC3_BH23BAC3_22960 [soil metagenome]
MFRILGSFVLVVFGFSFVDERQHSNYSEQAQIEPENNQILLVHDEDGKKVDVLIGEEMFTSYIYSDDYKPFLYPIYTAQGNPITRGYPREPRAGESTDHPHQVGLWLNYGDVNELDFWNNSERVSDNRRDRYGTIVHTEILNMENSGNKGVLEVEKQWLSPGGDVLIVENTEYHFFKDLEGESGDIRIIDRITKLTAQHIDIVFTDNKEGMLGLRLARELEHPDEHSDATGLYISSEGRTGHDVWGTRSEWMNLKGQIGEEKVSIAIFDHPENVGFPTYWHARGYGLYAANPLGMKEMSGGTEELNYQLAPRESLMFRHRVIISSGKHATTEELERFWQHWIRN